MLRDWLHNKTVSPILQGCSGSKKKRGWDGPVLWPYQHGCNRAGPRWGLYCTYLWGWGTSIPTDDSKVLLYLLMRAGYFYTYSWGLGTSIPTHEARYFYTYSWWLGTSIPTHEGGVLLYLLMRVGCFYTYLWGWFTSIPTFEGRILPYLLLSTGYFHTYLWERDTSLPTHECAGNRNGGGSPYQLNGGPRWMKPAGLYRRMQMKFKNLAQEMKVIHIYILFCSNTISLFKLNLTHISRVI